jgi:hypothetical protein
MGYDKGFQNGDSISDRLCVSGFVNPSGRRLGNLGLILRRCALEVEVDVSKALPAKKQRLDLPEV